MVSISIMKAIVNQRQQRIVIENNELLLLRS